MTRWQAFGAIVVFLAGCASGVIASVAVVFIGYQAAGLSYDELKAQGEQYIAQIDSYYEKHGVYPTYLEDAGIHPKRTRYGDWQYRLDVNKQHYQLSLGEYDSWDPFSLWWDSESRSWYLDT